MPRAPATLIQELSSSLQKGIGFNIEKNIDGSSETDGIEVSSANFGGPYHKGILVVQDGYKRLPDGAQNFKYIDWQQIVLALKLAD